MEKLITQILSEEDMRELIRIFNEKQEKDCG